MIRDGDVTISGKIDNLSMKGLFLQGAAVDCSPDPLHITIFLSGSSSKLTIELTGKVARKAEDGMAIQFVEMDLDSFMLLKNVVLYNSDDADAILEEYHRSLGR